MRDSGKGVCVVGAGVVGLCCALFLQRQGSRVVLIDKGEPGRACSYGNAGILTATDRAPIGLPGIIWSLPKWLLDPLGPMVVRPAHLPRMMRWGIRLMREARTRNVERIADDIQTFYSSSVQRYKTLLASIGASDLMRTSGYLCVYKSRDTARPDAYFWDLHARRSVKLEALSSEEMRQLVPCLTRNARYGLFVPGDGQVLDPFALSQELLRDFASNGGEALRDEVRWITPNGSGARVFGETAEQDFDAVVIAAGIWSKEMAYRLGSRVLLESMRGYHAMISDPGIDVPLPVLSGDYKFFASPMRDGLRLAGTAEFAGLHAPPDYRRADKLIDAARTLFPDLEAPIVDRWAGHRPMTPDSLPVVGPSPHHGGIYFAFGHGLNGLSGAPMTGQLIADMVNGKPPSIDPTPYSIARF